VNCANVGGSLLLPFWENSQLAAWARFVMFRVRVKGDADEEVSCRVVKFVWVRNR
jgi:hypothetical protein